MENALKEVQCNLMLQRYSQEKLFLGNGILIVHDTESPDVWMTRRNF